jgi:tetratricopeptide (TPR) repeat protein
VLSSPVGEARHEFTLPFSEDERSALSAWNADADWPLPQLSPQEVGVGLYQAIFGGAVGEALRRSQDAAAKDQQTLHIRLHLKDAPALAALPWQLLYDPVRGQPLAISVHKDITESPHEEQIDQPSSSSGQPKSGGQLDGKRLRILIIVAGQVLSALAALLGNNVANLLAPDHAWQNVAIVLGWAILSGLAIWAAVAPELNLSVPRPATWLPPRTFVVIGLVLAVVLTVTIIVIPRLIPPSPACPADQQCILLAEFSPAGEQAQAITADLTNELQRVVQAAGADNLIVVRTGAVTTQAEAQALAEREQALLIVWGVVRADENRTVINFQMADLLGIAESTSIRPYRVEPMQYDPVDGRIECQQCMSLSGEGTRQANVVAYMAVGLTQYAGGQAAAAQQSFAAALSCAGDALGKEFLLAAQSPCEAGEPLNFSPALIYYYLGKSLAMQGSYARGIEVMKLAAQANPKDAAAWIGIGSAYRNWSQLPDAEEAVNALQQAESVLEGVLEGETTTAQMRYLLHFHIGFVHELEGDYAAADKSEEDYAAADKSYALARELAEDLAGVNVYNILIALGRAQRLVDDFEAAAQTLEQAAKLEPDAPWAYLELATVHWAEQEDQNEALRWIDRATDRNPEQPYVYIVRGQLCNAWGDLSCAVAAYEQALSLRVGDGWLYGQLADLYRRQAEQSQDSADRQQARRYAELTVDARPHDPWAHNQLGFLYAAAEEYDGAIEHFEKAVDHAYSLVSAASSLCNLGLAYEKNQNPAEARVNYQRCIDHTESDELRRWAEDRLAALPPAD